MNRKISKVASLIVLGLVGSALATTFSWTAGASDNNWTTTGNWNSSGYPGAASRSDNAVIDKSTASGGGDFPVVLSTANTITDLTMQDGTSGSPVGLDVADGD